MTPREEEVFELLFKGHSRSYISESLFISENTVKAHTKNIYRKLGIHSRHELEKIIDT
ncbi:MAG: LuxR C-terminal-related transcriptional regulator [Coriobacteriales bacterium]|nr:LuxR C-terminal-related transcriptional regulator [Coriobacteriales bacterium]